MRHLIPLWPWLAALTLLPRPRGGVGDLGHYEDLPSREQGFRECAPGLLIPCSLEAVLKRNQPRQEHLLQETLGYLPILVCGKEALT